MRKLLSCVLMMTLLLAGCAAGQEEESPEQLANLIRGELPVPGGLERPGGGDRQLRRPGLPPSPWTRSGAGRGRACLPW